MNTKTFPNYEQALAELQRLAHEAYDLRDLDTWAALGNAADILKAWLDGGQVGSCPVDLAAHGLEVGQEEAPSPALETPPIEADVGAEVAVEDLEALIPTIETPEEAELRRRLDEARAYFDASKWREAEALSRQIVSHAGDLALKDLAAELRDRAQGEITTRLDKALADGDAARTAGDEDTARAQYRAALELSPKNTHARRSMIDLNGELVQPPEVEAKRLRAGLKEERDIKKLGEAVYRAEALAAEEKLPEDLIVLMKAARKYYDDLRIQMGQETTMMRFGNLEQRKLARDKIFERLAIGFKYTYDETINTERPTAEVAQDADKLLEQYSGDTAQFVLDTSDLVLPAHPLIAIERLNIALNEPFHAYHRNLLDEKLQKVKALIVDQEKAEALLEQAQASDDAIETFGFVLQATDAFPHIPGMNARLARARQTAQDTLVALIKGYHSGAEILFKAEEYADARDKLAAAEAEAGRWPEEQKPQALLDLLKAGEEKGKEIEARQTLRKEFERDVAAIREQVSDPNRRAVGRELFQELKKDKRFTEAGFVELRTLISEMDQYADFSEQLADAQTAKAKGEWERVYELAEKMKASGRVGRFAAEVDTLFEEALLELTIDRARRHLQNDEIFEANLILSQLIGTTTDAARKEELEGRLKDELARLVEYIRVNTPLMRKPYDRALSGLGLSDSSLMKIYLPTARDRTRLSEPFDEADVPGGILEGLRKALGKTKKDSISIQEATEGAALLLTAELNEKATNDRVQALRLFRHVHGDAPLRELQGEAFGLPEEEWGEWKLSLLKIDAGRMARLLAQSLRQDTLEPLEAAYQAREEKDLNENQLRRMAEKARILREAQLLETENEREAARWFEVELGRGEAKAKEELGDWDGALAIWQRLNTHYPRDKRIQSGLGRASQNQHTVAHLLGEVEKELQQDSPRNALRLLQSALNTGSTRNSPLLTQKRDEIFRTLEMELLKSAGNEGNRNDLASISQAALALFELQEIEELIGRAKSKRSSSREITRLENKLKATQPELAKKLPDLTRLHKLIREAESAPPGTGDDQDNETTALGIPKNHWEQAVSIGDFAPLEEIKAQIMNLDLDTVPMAQAFYLRLDETREVHNCLVSDIVAIRRKFDVDEDFEGMIEILNRNRGSPAERINKQSWKYMSHEKYVQIRNLMDNRAILSDAYHSHEENQYIIGWGAIKTEAEKRRNAQAKWDTWMSSCLSLVGEARSLVAQSDQNKEPLTERQQELEKICSATLAAIQKLSWGPRDEAGQPVPMYTRIAKQNQNQAEISKAEVTKWFSGALSELQSTLDQIHNEGGFPTSEEFGKAAAQAGVGNCAYLEQLVRRAEKVGSGNVLLNPWEFQQAATHAAKGNHEFVKRLLEYVDVLDVEGFPSSGEYETAISPQLSKEKPVEQNPLNGLLSQISRGVDFITIFRSASEAARKGSYTALLGYLKYADRVRTDREREENDRKKQYSHTLDLYKNSSEPTLLERLRRLFGR